MAKFFLLKLFSCLKNILVLPRLLISTAISLIYKFYFTVMLFKNHLFLVCLILATSLGSAAAQNLRQSSFDKTDKRSPVLLTFEPATFPALSMKNEVLKDILALSPADEMRLLKTETDELGFEHQKHQQFYNGIKVEHGTYSVHARQNAIESMSGNYIPIKGVPVTPALSESAALESALSYIGAQLYKWQIPGEEAWIKEDMQDPEASFFPEGELVIIEDFNGDMTPRLAWKFNVYAQEPLSRDYVYIDAVNGKVLFKDPIIKHANAVGTAATRYSGSRTIMADSNNGAFRLREARGTNSGIETYDLNTGTSYSSAVDFVDNDNDWTSAEWNNAQKDNAALDAHWGAENTYDYFLIKHNRNSYNNNGAVLKSYVHYSTNYDNAFWDGTRMTYGDGGSVFSPLTALDVCGHEIGHGVCSYTANLVYANESGALNEALSDIWGACIEYFAAPEKNTWLLGEDITLGGGALRSLVNPNAYNDPDTYLGTYWYTGTGDNGGVHTNSGVLNYFFYLLVNGGSGTNDIGNSYGVTGIGIEDAAKIVYRAESVYMSSNTNYTQSRTHMIQAATDLFGAGSTQVIATTNAMHAVGIGSAYGSCEQPGGLFVYNITPSGATAAWNAASASVNYTLEYKANSSSTWTVVNGLTSTTYGITGLTANTGYSFRVKNNCSTTSSSYTTYSFTTQTTGACAESLELNNSFSSATVMPANTAVNALIQVNGDNDYYKFTTTAVGTLTITLTSIPFDYDLKLYNSSGTQLGVSENGNTTNESITYTNAAVGTYYVYVYGWNGANDRNDCYILTATAPTGGGGSSCTDTYESNNTTSTAKTIAVNTDIMAKIGSSSDIDWFKFTNTSTQPNIRVTLTNLPSNYNLTLYRGNTLLQNSANSGTTNETITYNTTTVSNSYRVRVMLGTGGVSSTSCYTLKASISGTPFINGGLDEDSQDTPESDWNTAALSEVTVFPNPVKEQLHVFIPEPLQTSSTQVLLIDGMGRVLDKVEYENTFSNLELSFDMQAYQPGLYFAKIVQGDTITVRKFIVAK